jgi:hypothetical protein
MGYSEFAPDLSATTKNGGLPLIFTEATDRNAATGKTSLIIDQVDASDYFAFLRDLHDLFLVSSASPRLRASAVKLAFDFLRVVSVPSCLRGGFWVLVAARLRCG